MSLTFIHARLSTTSLLFSAICVAWGLLNFIRRQPVTSSYWGGLVILQVLMVAEVIVGALVGMTHLGNLARPIVHALYGATVLLSLPAAYLYTGGKGTQQDNLIYAVVCLWLVFIVDRSAATGSELAAPMLSLLGQAWPF
ncbi:MAG: hypothetical protein WAZ19_07825 [Anaerolineae bacterium]